MHSDQAHESAVLIASETPDNSLDRNRRIGFVAQFDIDVDLVAKRPPIADVKREAIEA
ncbi:MAG: hypothetical protein WB580_22505 [Candidatus Binataceae bacterium]